MAVLQEEAELNEIVQLGGQGFPGPPKDQITLETARMLREDFPAAELLWWILTLTPSTTARKKWWP